MLSMKSFKISCRNITVKTLDTSLCKPAIKKCQETRDRHAEITLQHTICATGVYMKFLLWRVAVLEIGNKISISPMWK